MKKEPDYQHSLFAGPLTLPGTVRSRVYSATVEFYATGWDVHMSRSGWPPHVSIYFRASLASIMRLARAVKALDGRGR